MQRLREGVLTNRQHIYGNDGKKTKQYIRYKLANKAKMKSVEDHYEEIQGDLA